MSRRPSEVLVPVLVALFVSLSLIGCQPTTVKKVERRPRKERVPIEKVKVTPIPKEWPKEIPIYPQAELLSATSTLDGGVLIYKTQDSADKIFAWYYDTLEAAKWTMKGPTLDVAQNLAIIKSELGELSFLLDARILRDEKDEYAGSTITLTTPAPKFGGP